MKFSHKVSSFLLLIRERLGLCIRKFLYRKVINAFRTWILHLCVEAYRHDNGTNKSCLVSGATMMKFSHCWSPTCGVADFSPGHKTATSLLCKIQTYEEMGPT